MKLWNNILLCTVFVLFIIAIIVFIKVFTHEISTMEIGSVTDMISSFCNIVMAFSAAYAAYNAKKWFNRKTTENAHIQAIKLKDEIEKNLEYISSNYWILTSTIHEFRARPTAKKADEAYDDAMAIKSKITAINQLKTEIVKIENLGIKIINKEILINSVELCLNFYASACSIFHHHYETLSGEFSTTEDIYIELLDNLPNLRNEAIKQYDILLSHNFNSIFKAVD